jgi:acetolactate synthase-1/2/3 large subunit
VHQDQPFLPKLTSRIYPDGSMKSNPIHLMSPDLPLEIATDVFRYLPENLRTP